MAKKTKNGESVCIAAPTVKKGASLGKMKELSIEESVFATDLAVSALTEAAVSSFVVSTSLNADRPETLEGFEILRGMLLNAYKQGAEDESRKRESFQSRVLPWMLECFGESISNDLNERNARFLEEALELVQACGATRDEAVQVVDYVFGRPIGEKHQEVGGVMITLAGLCLAQGLDMHKDGETELSQVWTRIEKIRAKQAAKPKFLSVTSVSADEPRGSPTVLAAPLPE
jgi:hypothetical protein